MKQNYPLHIGLFLATVCTTMLAGAEIESGHSVFLGDDALGLGGIWRGWPFSLAFLGFLTVHEFGHYLTAVYHKVKCSLPYYIPVFIPIALFNIGSFGAMIRIRKVPASRRKYFDIGVAGPLAGFVVALGVLIYGFTHLPPMEAHVLNIHPEYQEIYGGIPTAAQMKSVGTAFTFGGSLLFEGLKSLFQDDPNFPPSFEIMHYPFILAGFLGLFFTALNLLPIGQLDGGHVTYGLFGAKRAGIIARVTVLLLLFLGGLGTFSESAFVMPPGETFVEFLSWVIPTRLLYLGFLFFILQRIFKDESTAFQGGAVVVIAGLQFVLGFLFAGLETNLMWLFYALMTVRFIGVDHPIALDDRPLTLVQKVMGVLAILIFIICFSPNPLSTL